MTKKIIKYKEAAEELNSILESLESDAVDVDEVSIKVKKAIELIVLCREKIENTEIQVKKIVKEFESGSKKSPK